MPAPPPIPQEIQVRIDDILSELKRSGVKGVEFKRRFRKRKPYLRIPRKKFTVEDKEYLWVQLGDKLEHIDVERSVNMAKKLYQSMLNGLN